SPALSTTAIYTLSLHDALPICQGYDEPGEHVAAHVGEPVLFDRVEHGEPEKRERVTQGWRRIAEHGGDCAGEAKPIRACDRMNSDRKSTRLNSSHVKISYAVFC